MGVEVKVSKVGAYRIYKSFYLCTSKEQANDPHLTLSVVVATQSGPRPPEQSTILTKI